MKRWCILFLQVLVTACLLAWFFRKPGFRHDAEQAIQTANGWWLLAGFILSGIENFIGVFRWRIFLRVLEIRVPFWKSVQVYYIALFFNLFLVGVIGGDAIKVGYLIQNGHQKSKALVSVVLDRMSGYGSLLFVTLVFTTSRYKWLTHGTSFAWMVHFLYIYLACVTFLMALSMFSASEMALKRMPQWFPFRDVAQDMCRGYFQFVRNWKWTLAATLVSILMTSLYFGIYFFDARAYGVNLRYLDLAAFMPVVDVISALPISFGGMGVREWLFATILGDLCGVSSGVAASLSMTGFLSASAWGMIGMVWNACFGGVKTDDRSGVPEAAA